MTAILPTYKRFEVRVKQAYGTKIEDIEGKQYLDFGSGIGVCNLGHRHPDVQSAIEEQLNHYWHVSNLYYNPIQEDVAKLLTTNSVADYVFFCNSGAEANEAAIKLARKATEKTKIITFKQSFHGRTFATMSATGQEKIQVGFGPMLETFVYVPYNDLNAVIDAIDDETAAVMLELVQGEGGVIPAEASFVRELEKICREKSVVLIIDEIQTGMGRTGKRFAYEHFGIKPDILTLAKGLGNGLPVGAMLANEKFYDVFGPGSHGSTFGGNPLAMAAAKAVLNIVFNEEFLNHVQIKSDYLRSMLLEKISDLPIVKSIRGKGLMLGIECTKDISELIPQFIQNGLLVLVAGPTVIRLLPPLTVSKKEIDEAVRVIRDVLVDYK
ncbi:acetylornithine transaminase [Pueribacillus sp. YX66]|uniref:acetylornithine transaminase n=1 Tax=Pueribacillus sp. YX66 TaxID=3229242 RepID=UPI00358D4101